MTKGWVSRLAGFQRRLFYYSVALGTPYKSALPAGRSGPSLRPSRTASLTLARSRRSSGGSATTASWIAASRERLFWANRIPGCRAAVALSDHSIKAARHTTKYQLIGRPLVGHLRKLISGPTAPNASARSITPHDAPGLRFRHTAVDACLVAVGAFYQTRRKAISLPL